METISEKTRVAVIGAGVAGITAAYLLAKRCKVTLFEQDERIGGHTNTILVNDPLAGRLPVDTGFIVCNPTNYPNFYTLLDELDVPRRDSEMSFGFYCARSGFGYVGPRFRSLMRHPANFFSKSFVKMIHERRSFNRCALRDLATGALAGRTLGEYCRSLGCSTFFEEHYLAPLAAAIWSSPDQRIGQFPALTFVNFFRNHGMLELGKIPRWQTVVGGSHAYLRAFLRKFTGAVRLGCGVQSVARSGQGAQLNLASGERYACDLVVIAAHADQALKMLEEPSDIEKRLLGAWQYQRNDTVLHTDIKVLPPKRSLWASWNYYREFDTEGREPVAVTYDMNRLQGLKSQKNYLVTLNRTDRIDSEAVIYRTEYSHPVYTAEAVATQPAIRGLNGANNTYYCGSYLGYGFHEDAVTSAVEVAQVLGVTL